jgi:hypothetical protein
MMTRGAGPLPYSACDPRQFTSRLQKGGALLSDMRRLVSAWSDDMVGADPIPAVMRMLGKGTLARAKDTYIRAFRPRFIQGNPPQAWKLARCLEDVRADPDLVRPFYYWITARAEPALYEYATCELFRISNTPAQDVTVAHVVAWLRNRLCASGQSWTPTVQLKVARGILAALRDFGILEGRAKKKIHSAHLPPPAFALIAFCLHALGASGTALIDHRDWRLFLLSDREVERLLLESHQAGWLNYQAAGRIIRIDFPCDSFGKYAHVVLG